MNIKTLVVIPLTILLFGCGADDDTESVNERRLSTSELTEALTVSPQGTSDSLAGVWLMVFSSDRAVDDPENLDRAAEVRYLNGRQVMLITAIEGGYRSSICGTAAYSGDIDIQADTNETSYYSGGSGDEFTIFVNIIENRSMTGELYTSENGVHGQVEFTSVKLSDATTFSEASNELNIVTDLTVNDTQLTLAEIGNNLTCIGNSVGSDFVGDFKRAEVAMHIGFSTNDGSQSSMTISQSGLNCQQNAFSTQFPTTLIAEGTCELSDNDDTKLDAFDNDESILYSEFSLTVKAGQEDSDTFNWKARVNSL